MDNIFLQNKKKTLQEKKILLNDKEFDRIANRKKATKQLQQLQLNRLDNWIEQNANPEILQVLRNGNLPIKPIGVHNHVDRQKHLEKDETGILNKKYYPGSVRAQIQQNYNLSSFQTIEPMIFSNKNLFQRARVKDLEGPEMVYGSVAKLEHVRIQEAIQKSANLDYTGKNNQMLYLPEWKSNQPSKWMTQSKFKLRVNPQVSGWDPLVAIDHGTYVDGYEVIGDISRVRDRSKELNKGEFQSLISPNHYYNSLNRSYSLRTMVQDFNLQNKINGASQQSSGYNSLKNGKIYRNSIKDSISNQFKSDMLSFHQSQIRLSDLNQIKQEINYVQPKQMSMMSQSMGSLNTLQTNTKQITDEQTAQQAQENEEKLSNQLSNQKIKSPSQTQGILQSANMDQIKKKLVFENSQKILQKPNRKIIDSDTIDRELNKYFDLKNA